MSERIRSLNAVILPLVVIVSVLVSIFAGIATPTEAAAVGAAAVVFFGRDRGGGIDLDATCARSCARTRPA